MGQVTIGPQPGAQTDFLSSPADIVLYGGAAGSGKTFALLLEPLRHIYNSQFNGIIFRRQGIQARNPGGLIDESRKLYSLLGATFRDQAMEWKFPSGSIIKFAHLENESDVYSYQGAQIVFLAFDEICHFTQLQFTYMLSRMRSTSGIIPYVRMTCNPDESHWIKTWIEYYLNEDGFPKKERSGHLRWFVRQGDDVIWGETKEELEQKFGKDSMPLSFTFIPATLSDNKILMDVNPQYKANLLALDKINRERLLMGNWAIRATAGTVFRGEWFPQIETLPKIVRSIRFWDRAATEPHAENPDPDYTVGVRLGRTDTGLFVVEDVVRVRRTSLKVQEIMKQTAERDGCITQIWLEQEPGSSGVADIANLTKVLLGYRVRVVKPTNDKITRALPCSAQAEAGNILVLKRNWTNDFLMELTNFPDGKHDDQCDALSGAFNAFLEKASVFDSMK